MEEKTFKDISWEINSSAAIITIRREKVYNALTRNSKLELIRGIELAEKHPDAKSIIITGSGRSFSSGQDLNLRSGPTNLQHILETEWNPLVESIWNCPKIVIASINGVCAGAGISVALACDLIVARPKVKFVSGFSKLGLVPDAGSTAAITRSFGYQRSLEFFLFNNPLYSEDLHSVGLVNHITDSDLDHARSWAKDIAKMAPLSSTLR